MDQTPKSKERLKRPVIPDELADQKQLRKLQYPVIKIQMVKVQMKPKKSQPRWLWIPTPAPQILRVESERHHLLVFKMHPMELELEASVYVLESQMLVKKSKRLILQNNSKN